MAAPSKTRRRPHYEGEQLGPDGFDVVCTIGRVELGEYGPNPEVAAYMLIAEHGAQGTYRFPRADGTTAVVTVAYEGEPQ